MCVKNRSETTRGSRDWGHYILERPTLHRRHSQEYNGVSAAHDWNQRCRQIYGTLHGVHRKAREGRRVARCMVQGVHVAIHQFPRVGKSRRKDAPSVHGAVDGIDFIFSGGLVLP